MRDLFADSLKPRQPQPVQPAALETLARFDDPGVPALILAAWPGLSPQLRATAAETLFARPAWVGAFLDAVEQGKVKPGDVDPARSPCFRPPADQRTARACGQAVRRNEVDRSAPDVVAAYQKALRLKGDAAKGKAIFKKVCSACHRLEGVGEAVGAELSAIRDRGTDAILLNILDPNREVLPQYLSYFLVTDTGRTITGMITAETATSITIRRADGTSETVLRINIDELRSTGLVVHARRAGKTDRRAGDGRSAGVSELDQVTDVSRRVRSWIHARCVVLPLINMPLFWSRRRPSWCPWKRPTTPPLRRCRGAGVAC